jgi:L-seryl-tRNA(Ser) seleniumtransferase
MSMLLEHDQVKEALKRLPRTVIVESLRHAVDAARSNGSDSTVDSIVASALESADSRSQRTLRRAINATGIVLHTGLGRAVLSETARDAVLDVASGHSMLEIDQESGKRGSRQDHIRALLTELTGAESALALNNNAGAVFLCITAVASGKEVILSRGEMVEIGGAFRMPDIIRASGATLVEVGTTNRTRPGDFEKAITENTGLILRCHPSNFRLVGFTEEVPAAELAALGKRRGIPVMDDLGSGAIIDTSEFGAGPTVTLRQAVESGCDLVTASGDKLLGGPQAGMVLGRKDLVEKIGKHPLARALRLDKLTLAALEATLRLYRDPERARKEIPTLRSLSRTSEQLRELAERLLGLLRLPEGWIVTLVDGQSQVGGGSLPGENLPTTCVRIDPPPATSIDSVAARLRANDLPIFGRIHEDGLLLDPRTLEESEFEEVAKCLTQISEKK